MLLPADLREWVPADDLVHSEAGIPGVAAPGAGSTAGASEPPPPKDSQQINFTDPDSALMRKSRRDSCEQACNAHAAVDVGDSHLILGTVQRVLADGGGIRERRADRVGGLDGGPRRCHAALGVRQLFLRGLEKVRIEWDRTCLACNMRRMWRLAEA